METELLTLFIIQVLGFAIFGKFESHSPWWRSILKWSAMLALVWAVTNYYGHTASLWVIAVLFSLSLVVHFAWCIRNGIHPIHATPKRKYYQLRGWKWEE